MPQTIHKTPDHLIIAGVFSQRESANQAVLAFQASGVTSENIQILFQPKEDLIQVFTTELEDGGFTDSQAHFYDDALRNGKTFVAVHHVINPDPIVEIFDRFGAEYNLDGGRSVRRSGGAGVTAGVGAGVFIGGTTGLITAGPVGAAVGAAAGAVLGGTAGAASGKGHNK